MVDYTKYMKKTRDKYLPQVVAHVQMPPTREICPDCTVTSGPLSLLNSPVDYCATCDNKGFIETFNQTDVTGVLVDFMSDTQTFPARLSQEQYGNFDYQRYVFHASLSDCTTSQYPGKTCFDVSKELVINNVDYKILAKDESTLLGQIKVVITRTN